MNTVSSGSPRRIHRRYHDEQHGTLAIGATSDWKINLIERDNPHWNDLYRTLVF